MSRREEEDQAAELMLGYNLARAVSFVKFCRRPQLLVRYRRFTGSSASAVDNIAVATAFEGRVAGAITGDALMKAQLWPYFKYAFILLTRLAATYL